MGWMMYQIVTGVTSNVGVPSKYLVFADAYMHHQISMSSPTLPMLSHMAPWSMSIVGSANVLLPAQLQAFTWLTLMYYHWILHGSTITNQFIQPVCYYVIKCFLYGNQLSVGQIDDIIAQIHPMNIDLTALWGTTSRSCLPFLYWK